MLYPTATTGSKLLGQENTFVKKTILGILAVALVLMPCAFAVDGVVLINQSTVIAAGGFPYLISQPGSYKLSGNLTVPDLVDGIRISASNVTLDLNGFKITGASQGFASIPSTSLIKTVGAVIATTVRNGTLFGINTTKEIDFGSASGSVLEQLIIHDVTGGNTSRFGAAVIVRGVSNPSGTVSFGCPAVVADSIAFIFGRETPGSATCGYSFGFVTGTIL